jgi:hypothetical protein
VERGRFDSVGCQKGWQSARQRAERADDGVNTWRKRQDAGKLLIAEGGRVTVSAGDEACMADTPLKKASDS